MKKWLRKLRLRLKGKHICEDDGCLREAMECVLYDPEDDREVSYWYCTEHAQEHGFCWYCGHFWGGCEAFDFEPSGLCPNCKDEVKNDLGEYDEEYDYGDPCEQEV
jgi:hypothetical protein